MFMYAYMYIYMYVCIYVYLYTYTHIDEILFKNIQFILIKGKLFLSKIF